MSDETQEQYNPNATVKFSAAAGFEFSDIDGMFRAANCYLQSGFAPPAFRTPQQLIICWARGAELGLKPLQAIEGLTVINNRIGMMGDLALALVRQSGELALYEKEWTGEGDELTCHVTLQRKNSKAHKYSFSVAEAKKANIYDRSPTWKGYPKRMTYYRALGFGLRDEFSDVLKNMYTSEELQDLATLEAIQAEKTNIQIIDSQTGEQVEHRPDGRTPLETQLARDYPQTIKEVMEKEAAVNREEKLKEAGTREEKLMGPSADFAEAQARAPQPPLSVVPDDIQMADESVAAPPPEPPWWVDHEIKGVKSLQGRTVGSLSPIEMNAVESRWVPKVHEQIARATDDQLKDLKAFEERIAHDKTAKPW